MTTPTKPLPSKVGKKIKKLDKGKMYLYYPAFEDYQNGLEYDIFSIVDKLEEIINYLNTK